MMIDMSVNKLSRVLCVIGFMVLLAAPQGPVQAGGGVNTCDEASFNSALAGGGDVTFNCSGTITLTTPKTIASATKIDGNGYNVILDGGGSVQLFTIAADQRLELHDLTLQNGYTAGNGGAVNMANGGTLIIEDSNFIGNKAAVAGGAINGDDMTGATSINITISNSLFQNNQTVTSTGDDGGAIRIDGGNTILGLLEVSDTTFDSNKAALDQARADGGAIYIVSDTTVNLEGNTFLNNQAGDDGGAIANNYSDSIYNIANNTFSGNSAGYSNPLDGAGGGAIFLEVANLVQNTFYANYITPSATARFGSAIAWDSGFQTGIVRENIFVANTGGTADCADTAGGTRVFGQNNLTEDGSCNVSGASTTSSAIALDPTLQDNGGPTHTHALLPGSSALDTAATCTYVSSGTNGLFTDSASIMTDQRGEVRPTDGDAVTGAVCDIGAYESPEGGPAAVRLSGFAGNRSMVWVSVAMVMIAVMGVGLFSQKRRIH